MKKLLGALALILICQLSFSASAATLGPAASFDELLALAASAQAGDVLLVSGDIPVFDTLTPVAPVRITSSDGTGALRGLRLQDASVVFSDIALLDTLTIVGASNVELSSGVSVVGAPGASGLSFCGSGALLLSRGSRVTGGENAPGVTISHTGGEFYASLEGTVRGGVGLRGGEGIVVSPLGTSGAMMISGDICGGEGTAAGGHALNLYELSGNAYVTVDASLCGGSGDVGGNGIQLVSASDQVTVGISGSISGGQGKSFGGDALMLMNVTGSAAISLSGRLCGGNASTPGARPGSSLLLVGDTTASRTYVNRCILEDGRIVPAPPSPEIPLTPAPTAAVTPLPEITSSIDDIGLITPLPSDAEMTPAEAEHEAYKTNY